MKKIWIWMVILCLAVSGTSVFAAGADDVYAILEGGEAQSDGVLVEITSPVTGSEVYYGHRLTVEATAEAAESIARVEFYKDGEAEPFAVDTAAPYAGTLTCGAEAFSVTAKAYTASGLYNTSQAVRVAVSDEIGDVPHTWLEDFDENPAEKRKFNLDSKGETSVFVAAPEDKDGNQRTGEVIHLSIGDTAAGAPWADYLDKENPLSGTVAIEVSMMSETATWPGKKNAWFQFFDMDDKEAGTLMELNGSAINAFGPGRVSCVANLEAMRWYAFKFVIDFAARTYTVEVDGVQKGGTLTLPGDTSVSWDNITRIRNRIGEAGHGLYFDNWKIYSQPKQQEDNRILDENFDKGTNLPAGFGRGGTNEVSTATIVATPADADGNTRPGNSMHLYSPDGGSAPFFNYTFSPQLPAGVIIMEADIMPISETFSNAAELFYLVTDVGNIARLGRIENTNFTYWSGRTRKDAFVKNFTPKKWYHLKYTVRTMDDAKNYDLEVDGNPVVKNVAIEPEHQKASLGTLKLLQFRIAPNGEMYLDNWKVSTLSAPKAEGTVFTSESGVLSVNPAKAPLDLRSVTVGFSDEMNAESFDSVTLTNQAGEAVEFTGAYRADARQYVASITGAVEEGASYTLTFPSSVKNTAGIGLTKAETVEFTIDAPEIRISNVQYFGADDGALDKAATGGSVKATLHAKNYTDETKTVCMALMVFENGRLVRCAVNSQPTLNGKQEGDFAVTAESVAQDLTGCDVRLFVWSDFEQMHPLCDVVDAK